MKNYSRQREEIIRIIKKLGNHPIAEQIYFAVKQEDTSISRSTVYRNLNDLVENNVLLKIPMNCGNDRYELIGDKPSHGHIMCSKCGKLEEFFNDSKLEKTQKEILKNTEFSDSDESSFLIVGICNSCRNSLN